MKGCWWESFQSSTLESVDKAGGRSGGGSLKKKRKEKVPVKDKKKKTARFKNEGAAVKTEEA